MTDKLLLEYIKLVEKTIETDKEMLKSDRKTFARLKKAQKKSEASKQ